VLGAGAIGGASTGLYFPSTLAGVSSGVPVLFTGGQMGPQASALRFKDGIRSLVPEDAAGLRQLRPASFTWKADAHNKTNWGFIAEEMQSCYPGMIMQDVTGEVGGIDPFQLISLLVYEGQRLDARLAQCEERRRRLARPI